MRATGRAAEPAPFVLLDAPCIATGTIRRHPDLPWIKSAADLTISEALQSELLDAAADLTAPGGTLVYAVCSLEPEEGPEQVEAFLRRRTDFARAPIAPARCSTKLSSRPTAISGHCRPSGPIEAGWTASTPRGCAAQSRPAERIGDREIDLPRVRGQDRGREHAIGVVSARPLQHALEVLEIGVGRFVEARIVAIERGDAIDGVRSDRGGKLAREHGAVAIEPAPPQRGIGGVARKLLEIDGKLGQRCLQRAKRRVGFQTGLRVALFRGGKNVGPLIARLRPLFGLALGWPAGDAARQSAQALVRGLGRRLGLGSGAADAPRSGARAARFCTRDCSVASVRADMSSISSVSWRIASRTWAASCWAMPGRLTM